MVKKHLSLKSLKNYLMDIKNIHIREYNRNLKYTIVIKYKLFQKHCIKCV